MSGLCLLGTAFILTKSTLWHEYEEPVAEGGDGSYECFLNRRTALDAALKEFGPGKINQQVGRLHEGHKRCLRTFHLIRGLRNWRECCTSDLHTAHRSQG